MPVPFVRHSLVLGLLAAHSLSAVAADKGTTAAEAAPPPATATATHLVDTPALEAAVVRSEAVKYQAEKPASPKYTEPLRDTPQTITIVNEEAMKDQGLLSLRDVLATVPGITFGAGEGGGGFGDSINIRGFNANGDIAIDGVRDTAQYSRSDTFNLEQVEVVKGSASVYAGAGAVGGTVNLVSKSPKADDFTNLSMAIGSDNYQRASVDTNRRLDDNTALRVNVMTHGNDVPGRDYEYNKRWGVAPAITFGLGEPTSLTLAYVHQEDENTPQYGVPFFNGRPLPGVDRRNYYGYHNFDIQENDVDILTGIVDHAFSDKVKLRNLTRYSLVRQYLFVDPPQGTWCLPDGAGGGRQAAAWTQTAAWNPATSSVDVTTNATGYTGTACAGGLAPGQYQPGSSNPRGNLRDTSNEVAVNQSDVTWNFTTGAIAHTAVTGVLVSHENWELDNYRDFRNANGTELTYAPMSVSNPDSFYTGPRNRTRIAKNEASQSIAAAYAFDTLQFNDQWLVNAGLRYERIETKRKGYGVVVVPATTSIGAFNPALDTAVETGDDLLSWRTGVIYKPAENGSVYLVYGTSMAPSMTTASTSCAATTTNGTACTVEPEEAETIELGTKWDVLAQKLALTAAVFRNDRTNYRVNDPGNPSNPTAMQQLDGESRVEGIELGAAGLLKRNWSLFANVSLQQSEVLRGASARIAALGQDWTQGDPLMQVPELAASLWTTWDITHKVQVGYGITYQGEMYLTQHSGITVTNSPPPALAVIRSTLPLIKSQDYVVHNLSGTWKIDRQLSLQLNVKNVFDELYYTRIRANTAGWATPGDARSTTLAMNYAF